MESFTLTRHEMARLLLAIEGGNIQEPLQVLQSVWTRSHHSDVDQGMALPAFLSTMLPPIIEKLIKGNERKGFSLQEIAELGGLIECSNLSVTSMQNWVKRDFKAYFNCPKAGKKYSFNQTALLFIIDDLKYTLDFISIRKLFEIVFQKPEDEADDLVGPLALYASYTSMFEELENKGEQLLDRIEHLKGTVRKKKWMEDMVRSRASEIVARFTGLNDNQQEAIRNILLVAVVSIRSAYIQAFAKQYCNATLFLNARKW